MTDRTIHIAACVFGGRFVVSIEPRTVVLPSAEFRTIDRARAHASTLSRANGWPIIDNVGGDA